ncbi:MAG: outer membrane lipoprotein-sorting protein [Candidatus Binatia bacterium]
MTATHWGSRILAVGVVVGTIVVGAGGRAELTPGDVLDQTRWQEAKGMMPDAILRRFESGHHRSKIIEVPREALQWSAKFNSATEANVGKYEINNEGVLIEKATGTYPRFGYGLPFAQIEPSDPKAPYQIMYNFARVGGQVDDVNVFVNLFWVNQGGLDRFVDFRGQALLYGSRWSGPIENPDETSAKVLLFGVAPYDVVGLATLDWNYLDPMRWRSIWSFVPVLRRVRRLSAANSSDGIFGSHMSRDDIGTFAGRIHDFTWKLIGEKAALVPYTLPAPKTWEPATPQGFVLPANENAAIMPWPGKSKLYDQSGEQWTGAAWWPVNLHLAKRPVWILELVPKDPYYAYGKQFLWVDKEMFFGYYKEVYDKAGQYWKTIVRGGGIALNKEKTFSTAQADFGMALDDHANQASVGLPLREGNDIKVNVGLDPQLFTSQGLSRFGK